MTFQSFPCMHCGADVVLVVGPGRTRLIEKDVEAPIPDGFELPTCLDCGEIYMSPEFSEPLDKILREKILTPECDCKHCLMSKRINKFCENLPKEFRKEFRKITDKLRMELYDTSMDYNVLKSKIVGKWTSDVELIDGKRYKVSGKLVKE